MDYDNVLRICIPDLLLNFLSCHGFSRNNEYVVILKYPNRMSEYCFNKGFVIFECDEENLKSTIFGKRQSWCRSSSRFRLSHAMFTTITSSSNTLKNLLVNSNYHSSYSTQEFNTKKEQMSIIFNTYVTPQINKINHPAFIQEWKLNIDAAEHEKV